MSEKARFRTFADQLRDFSAPVADGFGALRRSARESGPIDAKHRELIMLGAFCATRMEGGFRVHTRIAIENGATLEELSQVALLTLSSAQGLAPVVEALEWAREEYEAVTAGAPAAPSTASGAGRGA